MSSLHDEAWEKLESIIDSELTFKEGWQEIIDFHASQFPAEYWPQIREVDIQTDHDDILEWLQQIVVDHPVPQSVNAIWFGIVRLWDGDNEKEYYSLYISGFDDYDRNNADWAAEEASYAPDNRYIIPDALESIEKIIQTDEENFGFLDWILPIAFCSLLLNNIIKMKLNKTSFRKFKKTIYVTVGYDDGDFVNIQPI